MTPDYELTLQDYIDILRRRALLMVGVFVGVLLIAFALAILLPPIYQSSGTILIESQQISSEFVATSVTGFASERIEVIKQRVMTRENLLRMINKYGLFKSAERKRVTSELIDEFRKRIELNLLSAEKGRRRNKATIAFNIAFEYSSPNTAHKVANELVTLFLDENIKSRVESATEATKFLSQEANRLKADLEKVESLVASYKQENANALPEHLGLHVEMLQRTELTLAELNRDYKAAENELRRLDLELTAAKAGGESAEGGVTEIERLKSEYQQAIIQYTENHPTVRNLKRRIEAIEQSGASAEGAVNFVNTSLVSKLRTLIGELKNRIASLEQQRVPMQKKLASLEQQIIQTPQVELGLSTLLRDHESARKKYEEIQTKQLTAQISENLEGENKSERFVLIEPPQLPDKPVKPNRLKILLIGIFLALGAAGGGAILLEMLNPRIRGKGALTSAVGQAPLVEIPYITTSDEHIHKRALIKKFSIGIIAVLVITSLLIHFLYMPLDLIFYKILSRFG